MSSEMVSSDNYIPYHVCTNRVELKIPYVRAAFVISLICLVILASCSHYIAISGSSIVHWLYAGGGILLALIAMESGRILNHKFKFLSE